VGQTTRRLALALAYSRYGKDNKRVSVLIIVDEIGGEYRCFSLVLLLGSSPVSCVLL
jgi:hypothetical protein